MNIFQVIEIDDGLNDKKGDKTDETSLQLHHDKQDIVEEVNQEMNEFDRRSRTTEESSSDETESDTAEEFFEDDRGDRFKNEEQSIEQRGDRVPRHALSSEGLM